MCLGFAWHADLKTCNANIAKSELLINTHAITGHKKGMSKEF